MRAILGGTFNPIHYGHLRLALEVHAALDLDVVHLVLSAQPPHREEPQVSATDRFFMLQSAVVDEPALLADDRELRRPQLSYTVDTLADFRREFGAEQPLGFIMGADAWLGFHTWHRWQDILDLCHIIIVQRPGYATAAPDVLQTAEQARHAATPETLKKQASGLIYRQITPELDISATAIRALLAEGGNPRYLLPDAVLHQIATKHLYT